MSVEPKNTLVEKNLNGLGFKIQNAGTKNSVIKIDEYKEDKNNLVMLSYYSSQLFQGLFLEGCLSLYAQTLFKKSKNFIGTDIPISGLVESAKFYAYLLKNEHLLDYDQFNEAYVLENLKFFITEEYMSLSEDGKILKIVREDFIEVLKFFGDIVQSVLDTYLTVLTAIDQISGKKIDLKE